MVTVRISEHTVKVAKVKSGSQDRVEVTEVELSVKDDKVTNVKLKVGVAVELFSCSTIHNNSQVTVNVVPHQFAHEAVHDEDEHPLQAVKQSEEVCHHQGPLFLKEEATKYPHPTQHTQLSYSRQHETPTKKNTKRRVRKRAIILI